LDEWTADEVALGVKEVLALPREKIEDRFNLEQGEGTTIEIFGENTRGMLGLFFPLHKQRIHFVWGGRKALAFSKTGIRPPDLLEYAKAHPMIRRLLKGAKPLEYSAHLIPEGGYNSMPKLYSDGILIAGDAAQMVNASHREGSNLAMTAGRLAAETVIEAKKKGDFSAKTLSAYQTN
jgi:electron transfer flavoprotein-quinone oxidoreductase